MANIKISLPKTLTFEGGLSNHPNDKGKETWQGISRANWPNWEGWKIIDRYKSSQHSSKQLSAVLSNSIELKEMVERFYKVNFWDKIRGDDLMNQLCADNIFDFAVNSGVNRAVRYAQRIVGVSEDGVMGPKSIKAINQNIHNFVTQYKEARLTFVRKIAERDPSQKVFLHGWETRIQHA